MFNALLLVYFMILKDFYLITVPMAAFHFYQGAILTQYLDFDSNMTSSLSNFLPTVYPLHIQIWIQLQFVCPETADALKNK